MFNFLPLTVNKPSNVLWRIRNANVRRTLFCGQENNS